MVGRDLLATAGHCIQEGELSYVRFVFGFAMVNADEAVTTFSDSQVYTPIEIVARRLEEDEDYAIVRVDRPITAPGAAVLPLRTEGTAPEGTLLGIIGHPLGFAAQAGLW